MVDDVPGAFAAWAIDAFRARVHYTRARGEPAG